MFAHLCYMLDPCLCSPTRFTYLIVWTQLFVFAFSQAEPRPGCAQLWPFRLAGRTLESTGFRALKIDFDFEGSAPVPEQLRRTVRKLSFSISMLFPITILHVPSLCKSCAFRKSNCRLRYFDFLDSFRRRYRVSISRCMGRGAHRKTAELR